MLATDLLPDLAAQLRPVEFLRQLDIKVTLPDDATLPIVIRLQADGTVIPPVGEITLPDVNS
jgi:hypothetical protein